MQVLGTSIYFPDSFNKIKTMMPVGSTSVFIGSSGVGKSSIVNFLTQECVQKINDVRKSDSKGRHTTTSSKVFNIDGHGLIIDTPGIREVQILGDQDQVDESFPELQKYIGKCKFSNCNHESNLGCAFVEAIEDGSLEEKVFISFMKLKREIGYLKKKKKIKTCKRAQV